MTMCRTPWTPGSMRLAFAVERVADGEIDSREVWTDPLPQVIQALSARRSARRLAGNLPDAPQLVHGLPPVVREPSAESPKSG